MQATPILAAALLMAGSLAGGSAAAQSDAAAVAVMRNVQGEQVGTVEITQTASGMILVAAQGVGLPPGMHGFHIHTRGLCEASNGFSSAGGHLAGRANHGVHSENGPHPGDMPNLFVSADGRFRFETFLARVELEEDWFAAVELFDDDGAAVMIHAGPDDYRSQPAGDAGDRIACGVLERR